MKTTFVLQDKCLYRTKVADLFGKYTIMIGVCMGRRMDIKVSFSEAGWGGGKSISQSVQYFWFIHWN